jgi:hypothetical protein
MRFPRLRSALAALSVCTMLVVGGATTASATFSACSFGSSSGNAQTCMQVLGSGVNVEEADATVTMRQVPRTFEICMVGPSADLPACNGPVSLVVGQAIGVSWRPFSNEPAGNYCAESYRKNSNGTLTHIAEACVNVHR